MLLQLIITKKVVWGVLGCGSGLFQDYSQNPACSKISVKNSSKMSFALIYSLTEDEDTSYPMKGKKLLSSGLRFQNKSLI